MGSCISKKTTSSPSPPSPLPDPPLQIYSTTTKLPEIKKPQEESSVKKEDFTFKHRKSHEIIDKRSEEEKPKEKVTQVAEPAAGINSSSNNGGLGNSGNGIVAATTTIRTSSCTKEEVDAILIQCGRLSRSSSTDKAALSGSGGSCDITSSSLQRSRKYSGSKRSFDFDNEVGAGDKCRDDIADNGDEGVADRIHRHRQRHRDSRTANSSPHGRRRTPSRERDQQQQQQQQQRSGSRERGGSSGGGGRRVSRSPGRRSESPITTNSNVVNGTALSGNANCRPGKMVSVPATVSSLAMDKSNNAGGGGVVEPPSAAVIKRVQVRRNVGEAAVGTRTAASPRSRSPARTNVKASNENQSVHSQHQQQPLTLSRSNSRKAEQSPYRRNPLSEIDNNVIGCEKPAVPTNKSTNNNTQHQAVMQKPSAENVSNNKVVQGSDNKGSSNRGTKEQQKQQLEEPKGLQPMIGNVAVTVIPSGSENLKPQGLTRSRSSRLSRDLDINPETLLNPNPSYTALLLEDINNFHQKSAPTPAFSLPPCVTKACSILEAVADLNSSTSSNLSCAFAEDRIRNPTAEKFNKNEKNTSLGANVTGKKRLDTKDPIVESEVAVNDDLMEPSFHKYVTGRRGAAEEGGDTEEQESSGSNSFVGGQQHWLSSSSWEPNSADSTDCYTSSRTNTRQNELSPLGLQRPAFSESGREMDEPHRRFSEKKRIPDNGIGRGRVGSGGGPCSMPIAAAAST